MLIKTILVYLHLKSIWLDIIGHVWYGIYVIHITEKKHCWKFPNTATWFSFSISLEWENSNCSLVLYIRSWKGVYNLKIKLVVRLKKTLHRCWFKLILINPIGCNKLNRRISLFSPEFSIVLKTTNQFRILRKGPEWFEFWVGN